MKLSMTLWKADPLYPNPFSPVQRALKFSAVFGTISFRRVISIRPEGLPPIDMSKKHTGLDMLGTWLEKDLGEILPLTNYIEYLLLACNLYHTFFTTKITKFQVD